MSVIKVLPEAIARQIAAGEVIERPASVLKELLENSIDAGSSCIDVTIQRGGLQGITVSDDGHGILAEDLPLALVQHATSKITCADDLTQIHSLGFRGEALASIAAVARVRITSCASGSDAAWCVINDHTVSQAAHPVGTTVAIRDLFYNVPARRKFLRSERWELQQVEDIFRRIALSHFTVGFSLKHQDKLLKQLPACQNDNARLKRLMQLCSKPLVEQAFHIDAEQNGLRLSGWIGDPQTARSQEPHQYFFINGRMIRDRLINHAIRQVYQPLCEAGKAIFYCLYLELDPLALDVNVHPTKHEVRFRDARVIHAFLTQTLTDIYQQQGQMPQLAQSMWQYPTAPMTPAETATRQFAPAAKSAMPATSAGDGSASAGSVGTASSWRHDMTSRSNPLAQTAEKRGADGLSQAAEIRGPDDLSQAAEISDVDRLAKTIEIQGNNALSQTGETMFTEQSSLNDQTTASTKVAQQDFGRLVATLDNRIVITQTAQGLCFIDLQRSVRQMLLQQLQQLWQADSGIAVRPLLMPQTLHAPSWLGHIEDFAVWLKPLGIEVQQLGPEQVFVRAIAKILQPRHLRIDYQALLDALYALRQAEKQQSLLHQPLLQEACLKQVVAHVQLVLENDTAVKKLLDEFAALALEQPWRHVTLQELETFIVQ